MKDNAELLRFCAQSVRIFPFLAAALIVPLSGAGAQFLQEAKAVKFGTGCTERVESRQTGLGICMIAVARSRVWCPNGKVYERDGTMPDMSLVRSVCGLNQAL